MTQPLITVAALARAMSPQRLAGYTQVGDRDQTDALARYLWNMSLASHLQASLHVFEVTLRNAIYDASLKIVDVASLTTMDIPCWLDATPTLLYTNELADVERAKSYLGDPRTRTAGHLIGKLGLGFWVQLTSSVYSDLRANGPRLWPKGLNLAFPFKFPMHVRPVNADREMVFERLHEIRILRNRAAHYEPIWDRGLPAEYDKILETLGWMNPSMVRALRALDQLPGIYAAGVAPYRAPAEQLLGSGP